MKKELKNMTPEEIKKDLGSTYKFANELYQFIHKGVVDYEVIDEKGKIVNNDKSAIIK